MVTTKDPIIIHLSEQAKKSGLMSVDGNYLTVEGVDKIHIYFELPGGDEEKVETKKDGTIYIDSKRIHKKCPLMGGRPCLGYECMLSHIVIDSRDKDGDGRIAFSRMNGCGLERGDDI